jgi:DNA gyrase/topoisomerase IV subunit B
MATKKAASEATATDFTISSIKDHAKTKGMWAGALQPILIPDMMGMLPASAEAAGGRIIGIKNPHTPALLKIFDEIIVNATDHAVACRTKVTEIDIKFDGKEFSAYNDGPGIPVEIHQEATTAAGEPIYVPEVAFSYFLAGTNAEKELTNVKGGINGLGAKLANVHSVKFMVETVDSVNKLSYVQRWKNRLDVRIAPVIKSAKGVKPFTRVTFTPAYSELGYGPSSTRSPQVAADIDAWIRFRAHQSAAYVGAKVTVRYNGEICTTTNVALLSNMLVSYFDGAPSTATVLSTVAKATIEPYNQFPINLAVIVMPADVKVGRRASAKNMTIINGVLSNKGSHINYFKDLLSSAIGEKVAKATKSKTKGGKAAAATPKAAALSGVYFVMCGALPGADWGGQRKDELQVSKDILEKYTLTAAFLKSVKDCVAEKILMTQDKSVEKVIHDKYTKATFAGKAGKKEHTYLMAAEGDSAITLLRAGLTQSKKGYPSGGPTLDWCGIISLQGVIVNAAREVTSMKTTEGDIINVRSAKLQENKRLLALADAFGLRYDRTYTTPEELATLNYGQLLLCVDQDLDGTGKIAALVLVWIYLFWPALIAAGKVGRLMTPLIRVYGRRDGKLLAEFHYEEELHRWLADTSADTTACLPVADTSTAAPFIVKYYKGLATHDEDEVKRMFTPEAFKSSIYTYTMDETAARLFEIYFGADPALRKAALVTPVEHLTYEVMSELRKRRQIPVGRVQLDIDTKSYKNDAIKRQISGGCDGLNPARRKILLGTMMRFTGESSARELKIFQLGGFVADKCFYHHGDASLNGTIVYMAQSFAGARKYPFLIGVGQFGSRHGDKAGSARYISVKKSPLLAATFPPQDRWHLTYVFEDGERAEPQYFVPVVPMSALESYRIVSEGWNHDSHGRDLDAVLKVVHAYINGHVGLHIAAHAAHRDNITALMEEFPLPPSLRGFSSEVRRYRGEEYSFGNYIVSDDDRTLTITELPMGVTTAKYLETLTKPGKTGKDNPRAEFIDAIFDKSSSDQVLIEITLKHDAIAIISTKFGGEDIDPIEDAFMLRTSLRPHLNYYSVDGAVLEFDECYLATILYWAPIRHNLYVTRVTREKIVAELRLIEENAILRYIEIHSKDINLSSMDNDDRARETLEQLGYPTINSGLLHRPEYTPNDKLADLVLHGPGATYDYILNLRERDLVRTAAKTRVDTIARLESELIAANACLSEPVACASLWRSEIQNFLSVVEKGIATRWKFK